jgi:hypothetical protein
MAAEQTDKTEVFRGRAAGARLRGFGELRVSQRFAATTVFVVAALPQKTRTILCSPSPLTFT